MNLKTRVISAIVALLIVIPLLILGGYYFSFGVCLVAILAYKELIDLKKSHIKIPFIMVVLGLISMLLIILSNYSNASIYKGLTYQTLIIPLLFLLIPTIFFKNNKYMTKDAFYLIGITYLLGIVFNSFIILRIRSLYLFLYLIIIPMVTDTFAMLSGKFFGKHKMCPTLSPHKTWEGFVGGLFGGLLSGLLIYKFLIGTLTVRVIITTIILSLVGQMGDLVMSKIKRENEIKDFSNIMPGHGGILDRLDSIIFVVLTYMFLLIL